jgi:hypothetical protein
MNTLKDAFKLSRAESNIDVVLPVLKAATLHLIVAETPENGGKADFIRTKSPNRERWCVTAAEDPQTLKSLPWPKRQMTGAELLAELPPDVEIVVAYGDGGDYLTREQLEWFRSSK